MSPKEIVAEIVGVVENIFMGFWFGWSLKGMGENEERVLGGR